METPKIVYAAFAGGIDPQALGRIFQGMAAATQGGTEKIHLLFQSTGGTVGDGIALYNFFRSLPIDLHIYNTGSVQSVATLSFLGAKYRHCSRHGSFMIHKTHFPTQIGINAGRLQAMSAVAAFEDARTEAILRAETTISIEKWNEHVSEDVVFNAQEAIDFGIAQDICEFQIPSGNQIFNI